MIECFVCGEPLYVDQEWRLNSKYVAGVTRSTFNGDEYGHKSCVEGDDDDE